MKSEERHQLLTNDLEVVTKRVAGTFEQHAGTAIAVVMGIVVAIGIGIWWTSTSDTDVAAAWTRLDTAQTLEDFGDISDKYKGKPAGQWAELISSERILQTAMPMMFSNRELALTDISKSRQGFDELLSEKNAPASIRERAMWGLALCLETSCDGNTEKPIKAYERLLADFPDSMFKTVAEERITELKRKEAADFYAWFSKENPRPPEAVPRDFKDGVHLPAPKGPGDANEFDDDLDSLLPKKSESKMSEDVAPKTEKPTDEPKNEKPAGSDTLESSEKPVEKN